MKQEFNLSEYEGYKVAFDKWSEIKTQLDQAEGALQTLLFEGKPDSFRSQKERQVEAILNGVEPSIITAGEKWRENIGRATQRRNLFMEASRAQERKVSEQRMIASKTICETVLPEYKIIIEKKAKELIALGQTITEEKEFLERLSDENVAYSGMIIPMPLKNLGDPGDPSSGFALWLMEVVRIGFLEFKNISKHFRERWYRSNGFQFLGDKLASMPYSESDYAGSLKGHTVSKVLDKARKNGQEVSQSI